MKNIKTSKKKNNKKEYKLEAYIIKRALEANGLLPIGGKKWRLLDAERNFAKKDLTTKGKRGKLDILAYDEEEKNYIILELKARRKLKDKSNGADEELDRYTSIMQKHIGKANYFYAVEAKDVKGYIVWPSGERHGTKWGIIEFDKKELDNLDNMKDLNFIITKEPD